jgi:hypothetical protein
MLSESTADVERRRETMAKHTVELFDRGVSIFRASVPSTPDSMLMTIPRQTRTAIDDAYRSHFGIQGGSLAFAVGERSLSEVSPSVFESRRGVEVSVYRIGADGVSRHDGSSYAVECVCVDDYIS